MQTLNSVLGSSVRRLIIFYIIPALVLILGVAFIFDYPALKEYLEHMSNSTLDLIFVFVIAIVICLPIGYLLEDLGSRWEVKYCVPKVYLYILNDNDGIHRRLKRHQDGLRASMIFSFAWERFLSLKYHADGSTGHRFLRYMLERLKFELNAGFSFYILFIISMLKILIILINAIFTYFDHASCMQLLLYAGFTLFFWSISYFLLVLEASATSQTLHETRLILVLENDLNWKKRLKDYSSDEEQRIDELDKSVSSYGPISKVPLILFLLSLLQFGIISDLLFPSGKKNPLL